MGGGGVMMIGRRENTLVWLEYPRKEDGEGMMSSLKYVAIVGVGGWGFWWVGFMVGGVLCVCVCARCEHPMKAGAKVG